MKEPVATTETIQTRHGLRFSVEKRVDEQTIEVRLWAPTRKACVLHWGVRLEKPNDWHAPPQSAWSPGTVAAGLKAVQTPLAVEDGQSSILIRFSSDFVFSYLDFVLYFPEEGVWDNNRGKNYEVRIPRLLASEMPPLMSALRAQVDNEALLFQRIYAIAGEGQLAVAVTQKKDYYHLVMLSNVSGPLVLQWGVAGNTPTEWGLPPAPCRPVETTLSGGHTAQTPMLFSRGLHWQELQFPRSEAPLGVPFVIRQVDTGRWFNDRGRSFYAPLRTSESTA